MVLKIGDKVRVIDHEEVYSSYGTIFRKFNFANTHFNDFPNRGKKLLWTIFGVDESSIEPRYAIRTNYGHEIFIHYNGVKLLEKKREVKFKVWF